MERDTSFRSSASFGKRIEYNIIGRMLMDGLDVYVPLVDDHGVDCIVKNKKGKFVEIQIKARSENQTDRAALFANITHHDEIKNYYYVFWSEAMSCMWILSGAEFLKESRELKGGAHAGSHTIKFNGCRNGQPYPLPKYDKYRAENFARFNK